MTSVNPTSDCAEPETNNKRKRRPAGAPDPDAEVVSLSPKTLLESDRFVCEICKQGFQREQNLQMHRRRHRVPWKLLKRDQEVRKRVFVCPEAGCVHHHPSHALGDLVGIKKHFRRKHSNHREWLCHRCSKAYAVHSDYKAHLKTCGTRGHSCDCGRVFSRVESFIEHQDACNKMGRLRPQAQAELACLSGTGTGTGTGTASICRSSPSSETAPTAGGGGGPSSMLFTQAADHQPQTTTSLMTTNMLFQFHPNLDLQLSSSTNININHVDDAAAAASNSNSIAMAEEERKEAKREVEVAELEYANAMRIRRLAQAELDRASAFKAHALQHFHSTILQITCHACKHHPPLQFGALTAHSHFYMP